MKIVWTPQAENDRAEIWTYIAQDDADAAVRLDQTVSEAVGRLRDFPSIGHPGTIAGTRELLPHRSYRLVYEIVGDTVWILALVHTARRWPPVRSP